jgi:endonuclease-3
LTARASPYHSSVILFEADDATECSITSLRRSKRAKVENPVNDIEDTVQDVSDARKVLSDAELGTSAQAPKKKPSKAVSPRKPKPIRQSLAIPHPAPAKWREAYDAIKVMRSRILAPVDTMGCDQAQLKEHDPKVRGLIFIPFIVECLF